MRGAQTRMFCRCPRTAAARVVQPLHNSLSRHPVQSRYVADLLLLHLYAAQCRIFDGDNYKIDEYDQEIETKWKKNVYLPGI